MDSQSIVSTLLEQQEQDRVLRHEALKRKQAEDLEWSNRQGFSSQPMRSRPQDEELNMYRIKTIMHNKLEKMKELPNRKYSLAAAGDKTKHQELKKLEAKHEQEAQAFIEYQALINDEEVPLPIGKAKYCKNFLKDSSIIDVSAASLTSQQAEAALSVQKQYLAFLDSGQQPIAKSRTRTQLHDTATAKNPRTPLSQATRSSGTKKNQAVTYRDQSLNLKTNALTSSEGSSIDRNDRLEIGSIEEESLDER